MTPPVSKGDGLTPLMRQFNQFKTKYPDKILFFRMGDFYEMFGDDAVKAAPILNIALTSRGNINGQKIPLAGVPHHSAEKYLTKLINAGEKVVVVEQVEDPKLAKGIVKRDVVEIITPGTSTIEGTLDDTTQYYLASLHINRKSIIGLAYIDLSTGRFNLDEGPPDKIFEKLRVLSPKEILFSNEQKENEVILLLRKQADFNLTGYEEWNFDYKTATRELSEFFGVSTLDGFGVADYKKGLTAAGAIYRYLRENNRTKLDHIKKIMISDSDNYMMLDYNSIRNLELVKNLSENSEKDSLYSSMNRTSTPGGARRLKENILHPYKKLKPILYRQNGVKELFEKRDLAVELPSLLKKLPDMERLSGRLGMRKINPRQLAYLRDGLNTGDVILKKLKDLKSEILSNISKTYPNCGNLINLISTALVCEPPLVSNKGGLIKEGYSDDLDQLKGSIAGAKNYIASLQTSEKEKTGIPTLKVGYNKVFGYFIEITKTHQDKVPDNYIRKQTLVNAERYITQELKEKEDLIFAAEEKIFSLEDKIYSKVVDGAAELLEDLLLASEYLSEIDMIVSLSNLAHEKMYCCPELNEGTEVKLVGGRHPVIEDLLPSGSFISNNLSLSDNKDRIMVLTGPNMSGKSTYLRQIGLLAIMAQIGSYVPAESLKIGLVDRVFTRVGAIDNLARGQSTFLVEMIETSNILNNATESSLILLDEVGRGTSTFDGLSIAWGVVEYLNEKIKARTIFATHYHELTGMADLFDRIVNFQVAVKRYENQIVFLHKIIPGGCDDSYGIEVARLAGIPRKTISRSRELLKLLESGKFSQSELARGVHKNIMQHSLFEQKQSPVEDEIKEVDINNLTPMEALRLLGKLKELLDNDG
ncbi:MAG: DNA mismatch repair protein MutS [candidate division Zixibacteria bacterium]|nr:DNA mismatch repair protein MutS [candidate division Zixibacteria bacterium]